MRIRQVVIDSNEPRALADFWSFATGREVSGDANPYLTLQDPEGRDVTLLIQRVEDDIKPGKNPVHIDLFTSDPEGEADALVARGASRLTTHDGSHKVIILNDPQGNVFCVIDGSSEP